MTSSHPASVPTPLSNWLQSDINKQQVTAFVLAMAGLFGAVGWLDWAAVVTALFAGGNALLALWTLKDRIFKPTPPITQTAIDATVKREVALKKAGEASPGVMPDETK